MNNELTLWEQPSTPTQIAFNWDETFAETKELVKEDAELTATIDDAMVKRFHGRVKIGFNLMALQAEHSRLGGGKGDFTTRVLPELGIDERSSRRYVSVARLVQETNRTRVSGSDLFDSPLPMNTWYKLASPSDASKVVVEQLQSGEIAPTQAAITKALEEEKQRAKQLEDDLEEERRQHSLFKDQVETNEQAHTTLIQSLEQKLEEKPEPVTVIEYQDTLETAANVAILQAAVKAHETKIYELEGKSIISSETREELASLQQELKNAQIELGFYEKQNKDLADKNNQLSEESRRSFSENINIVGQLRIRQEWQYATGEVQAAIRKFHTKVPSEVDRKSFEGEENTRTYQTIEVLEQTAAMLKKTLLGSDSTIDADIATTAIIQHQPAIPATIEHFATDIDSQALFAEYQQFVKEFPDEKLWWRAPQCGIKDMEMDRDLHIHYTRELLKSGDPYRITAAIEGMKRTLGFSM